MASLAAPFPTDALRDAGAQMRQPHRSPTMPAASAAGRSSYGGGRPNWAAFGLIGAAHVAAVAVLMTTGVIQTGAAPPPVRVNFVEEIVEPAVPPPAPLEVIEPVPTEVFLPDVIVETTAPPPPPTVTASEIPPAPQTMAAPVVSRSIDAPVVPPDFSADQLNNPGPRYPSASRRSHEEGTVTLKVLVSPDGRAQELSIAASSGFPRLDEAALATVKRWAFLAAKKAGRPVSAWVLVPVTFDLGDGAPAGRRGRGGHDRRGEPSDRAPGPGAPTST